MLCSRLKFPAVVRQFSSPENYNHPSSSKRSTLPAVLYLEACVCCLWSFLTNKPNSTNVQMNVNPYSKMNYKIFVPLAGFKTNPNKPNFKRQANPALCGGNAVSHELIAPILPLYKPANDKYYSRRNCRCSSMEEHSFRKAEVEGSTPSIGFVNLKSVICLKSSE